jgi:hypothetical protein
MTQVSPRHVIIGSRRVLWKKILPHGIVPADHLPVSPACFGFAGVDQKTELNTTQAHGEI